MYKACGFEVFGKVQGVYFRKYTQENARRLGVVGWVMNTSRGTVVGEIQGTPDKTDEMKIWLQNTGSPMSTIDKTEFKEEQTIESLTYGDFDVRR